ncbi:hypothetical protein [Luteimonas sp. gir]|uniref:hypothetical protein n=1 Tax=Luteimonas sp. gir TaxID=3127960 RepID=UPI003075B197
MAAGLLVTSAIVALIVVVAGRTTNAELAVAPPALLSLAMLTAAGGGLLMAGFALVFKKTRSIVLLMTFGLMPVMMADGVASWVNQSPAALLLPFVGPLGIAKGMIIDPGAWSWSMVAITTLASLGYFILGLVLFSHLRMVAMRRGTVGHY